MPDISELFGGEALTYAEFQKKLADGGIEYGDIGEVRRVYEDRICELRCLSALERELERSGVRNTALVTKLIDMEKISADDEGVHGIGEQLDALRESDPYLFTPERKNTLKAVLTGESHRAEQPDYDKLSDADFYKQVKSI